MFNGNNSTNLKYRKRDNVYKNSTGTNMFYVDDMKATSYGWWCYFIEYNGKTYFNDYPYSPTTSNHQWQLKDVLGQLNIKIDHYINQRDSLIDSLGNLYIDLEQFYEEMYQLEIEINRKGSKKSTNEWRKDRIKELIETIKQMRKLGGKFSNKQKKELKDTLKRRENDRLEAVRKRNKEVKQEVDKLKPQLNDLGPVDFGIYDKLNDLNSI